MGVLGGNRRFPPSGSAAFGSDQEQGQPAAGARHPGYGHGSPPGEGFRETLIPVWRSHLLVSDPVEVLEPFYHAEWIIR